MAGRDYYSGGGGTFESRGGGGGPRREEDPSRSLRSVYVGNIPWRANEDELKQLFSQAGHVAGFKIVYDRESGRSKGFGFCEFSDEQAANNAVSMMNGVEIHGRRLRVDRSR